MRREHVIVISAIIVSVIVIAVLLASIAKGNIIVILKDTGTGRPIGRVNGGYPKVLLDGVEKGYVTDYGELRIEGVDPGIHELTIIVPHYGQVRKTVYAYPGKDTSLAVMIDVPNPVFRVAVEARAWYRVLPPDERGDVKVTLANIGDVYSSGTSVLVLVYREDNPVTPIAARILYYSSLTPVRWGGTPITLEWKDADFVFGVKEVIAVVVFDAWPFTPQNLQVVNLAGVPPHIFNELALSITNYLRGHPEAATKTVAGIFIAWYG